MRPVKTPSLPTGIQDSHFLQVVSPSDSSTICQVIVWKSYRLQPYVLVSSLSNVYTLSSWQHFLLQSYIGVISPTPPKIISPWRIKAEQQHLGIFCRTQQRIHLAKISFEIFILYHFPGKWVFFLIGNFALYFRILTLKEFSPIK